MADPETTANEAIHETDAAQPPAAALPPAPPPAPQQAPQQADIRYAPPAPTQNPPQARMPFLAGLFSVFPGLGNVYNGLYLRGITFFVICIGLIGVAASSGAEERALLILTTIFVWFFNIFDAYRQATLINYGYTPDVELPAKQRVPAWSSGGLVLGVVVFLLGLYFFLHNRFDFDLSIVFDNVDILLMAFGAFLIGLWVVDWKKKNPPEQASDGLDGI